MLSGLFNEILSRSAHISSEIFIIHNWLGILENAAFLEIGIAIYVSFNITKGTASFVCVYKLVLLPPSNSDYHMKTKLRVFGLFTITSFHFLFAYDPLKINIPCTSSVVRRLSNTTREKGPLFKSKLKSR